MKIREVIDILEAQIFCGEDKLDHEVRSACGADLMSDVLAFVTDHPVLLTGLANPQVVRTADMMDIKCIVFTRGKVPDAGLIDLGKSKGMTLLSTRYGMYISCGKLYSAGIPGAVGTEYR